MTNHTITKATPDEKRKVRHITFRTSDGKEGVVTGIGLTVDSYKVWMYSAGCLHGEYTIPATATILKAAAL